MSRPGGWYPTEMVKPTETPIVGYLTLPPIDIRIGDDFFYSSGGQQPVFCCPNCHCLTLGPVEHLYEDLDRGLATWGCKELRPPS